MSVREKMLGRRGNVGDALKRPLAVNAAFFFLILFFGGLYFSSKYWSDSKGVQDALKACAGILFVLCCIFNFPALGRAFRAPPRRAFCRLMLADRFLPARGISG